MWVPAAALTLSAFGCVTAATKAGDSRERRPVLASVEPADPDAEREIARRAARGVPELAPGEVDRRVIVGIRLYAGDPRDPSGRGRVPNWSKRTPRAIRWFESEMDAWRSMSLIDFIDPRHVTADGSREHYAGLNGHHEPGRRGDGDFKRLAAYAVRVFRDDERRRSGGGGSDR